MFYEVIPGRKVGRGAEVLTYTFDEAISPGTLVEVPLGRTRVAGVVVKKVAQPDFACRAITKILYSRPLPPHLVDTARWMAEYYLAPLPSVVGMMLPVGVLKKRRVQKSSVPQVHCASEAPQCDGSKTHTVNPKIPLNQAQKNALEALQKGAGATKLLFGVTGSGKTNIYLKLALNALEQQKSTILLVPEIALTGQLVRVFREQFGDRIIMIHSKQTEAERHLIFEQILDADEPLIVVGPRSALFAPLKDLGLIIVDEEHENTYYQENAPKYSAVRVASIMAKVCGGTAVLGSATPTVADYYVARERGALVRLTEKAKKTAVKPKIQIIDLKDRASFTKNRYLSDALIRAVEQNLTTGRQTLIFHNRRGSSPLTICDACGEELLCPECFLPLTLHADNYELACHTCGYHAPVPVSCPKCGHPDLVHKGFGTKLLETEIRRLFPSARVKRFDADTKKGEGLEEIYSEVREGAVDVIIGTQTIAKGLDLPKLATVGVVVADAGMNLPDYAAEEKTFQLLTQVIGRVGRGHIDKAEVIIQTYRPEHPVVRFAVAEDYERSAEYLLQVRRRAGFPPYRFVARCDITMKTEATVLRKVREAARGLGAARGLVVSPPMPAFHERTSRGYTWQIIVRARSRAALISACSQLDPNFRVSLDPPSLL